MNLARSLYDQQLGIHRWTTYQEVLKRLQCSRQDHYTSLVPSNEDTASPILACRFAEQSGCEQFVAIANEKGIVTIRNTLQSNVFNAVTAHDNAIFDLAWSPVGGMQLVTASGDHTARLFSVENGAIQMTRVFEGHSRSLKTVAFRADDSAIFATGGRDGHIILWDARTSQRSGTIDRMVQYCHRAEPIPTPARVTTPPQPPLLRRRRPHHPNNFIINSRRLHSSVIKSVTGLLFLDEYTVISCGSGDGYIKFWDIRRYYGTYNRYDPMPKRRIYCADSVRYGYSHILLDRYHLKLYANCLNGKIYCYNVNSVKTSIAGDETAIAPPPICYTGHTNSSFYVKTALDRTGRFLISGSTDENAYIWNTEDGTTKPIVKLVGHSAEVTCVDWSPMYDTNTIVTCSDDMTYKIWRINCAKKTKQYGINSDVLYGQAVQLQNRTNLKGGRIKVVPTVAPPPSPSKVKEFLKDLPNFVCDGRAPHTAAISSPQKKRRPDWLSEMRNEHRRTLNELQLNSSGSTVMGNEGGTVRPRKIKPSLNGTGGGSNSPILSYFKVTNSSGTKTKPVVPDD